MGRGSSRLVEGASPHRESSGHGVGGAQRVEISIKLRLSRTRDGFYGYY